MHVVCGVWSGLHDTVCYSIKPLDSLVKMEDVFNLKIPIIQEQKQSPEGQSISVQRETCSIFQ